MLNLFRHSEEADLERILAQHAVRQHRRLRTTPIPMRKQFRDLLQALPAAIYTTDANGRITFFNRACIEFAGRTPKIGDMWCVTWKLFSPDGTPLAHEDCPMAIALKENRPVRNVEAIAERPDGSRICFMPYPTPLRDATGRLIGAVNMLVDITTRKQAEERMMLLTGEVDHRSNNLLAVIQAMLRLTKADTAEEFQAAFQGRLERARQCAAAVLGVALDRRQHPDDHRGRASALCRERCGTGQHQRARYQASCGAGPGDRGFGARTRDQRRQIRLALGALGQDRHPLADRCGDNLLMHWTESGGPTIAEPMRKGFGVDAIDGLVRTLSGRITRQWKPEGLVCELSFPGIAA